MTAEQQTIAPTTDKELAKSIALLDMFWAGPAAGIEFLRKLRPHGPWNLVAAEPNRGGSKGRWHGATFYPDTQDELGARLAEWNSKANVYYRVNSLKQGVRSKLAQDEDVAQVSCLQVDVDPPKNLNFRDEAAVTAWRQEALERINGFHPRPSFCIDTGGGYQALWLLSQPADPEQAVSLNKRLDALLEGDHKCHNISRLFRLPGTINIPDERKRACGRKAALSGILWAEPKRVYTLTDFPAAEQPPAPATAAAPVTALVRTNLPSLEELSRMLEHIDPAPSEDWESVTKALKLEYGDAALDLWDRWSQRGGSYDRENNRKRWNSFKRQPGGGKKVAGIGSLVRLAKQGGYVATAAAAADEFQALEGENKRSKETIADRLVALALQQAELFRSRDGDPYADIRADGNRKTLQIASTQFRDWLQLLYFEATAGKACSDEHIKTAKGQLSALAKFRGAEREVFMRSAWVDDGAGELKVYIDLGTDDWSAVECTASGWTILAEPPVRFRRTAKTGAFTLPVRGGRIAHLKDLLNIQDEDFPLVVAWLLGALRGRGPYPILAISGPAGAAKTTFGRLMLMLVDPRNGDLRSPPKDIVTATAAMAHSHLLAYDNMSTLSHDMSDAFCRAATGGEVTSREYYTNSGEHSVMACRPIFFNGCEAIIGRPDLADRAITIELLAIPQTSRRSQAEIEAAIHAARPLIFGALLDAICIGLRELPDTQLDCLPRMADFALWATAAEKELWAEGTFIRAYQRNQKHALAALASSDPVANAIVQFMAHWPAESGAEAWAGSSQQLLNAIARYRPMNDPHGWPRTPEALSKRIRGRIAPLLKEAGIHCELDNKSNGKRYIRLELSIFRAED